MPNTGVQFTGKIKTRAMIACPDCGREFQKTRKADLQRHMRIHTNEKPYTCPFPGCGKAFRQSSALKNHSNFHQRDNAFTCQQCQMNFFDKPTYNRHMKEKHELEFVYACSQPGCGKHFKRKPVFKGHMQDRHGIGYSDLELQSHRVSAAPYLKASGASTRTASCTNASTLPKLSDAIENASYSPHTSSSPYTNTIRTSSPASYAYGTTNNGVSLRDPYMKQSLDAFSVTPIYAQEMYSPVDFHQTYSPEVSADLWIQQGYGGSLPEAAAYYIPTPSLNYMNAPTMVVSPPSGGTTVPPPPPYSAYPQGGGGGGNGTMSVGSISPHSSRSSSSSPVSSLSSLHAVNKPVAVAVVPPFPNFVHHPIHPQGQY